MQCDQSTILRQLKFGRFFPSLIDVKGVVRPKEFTEHEDEFQQWSKKTGAMLCWCDQGMWMMLKWTAEQLTEITTTAIDLEVLADGHERGWRSAKLGVCDAADAHSTHGSHELRTE